MAKSGGKFAGAWTGLVQLFRVKRPTVRTNSCSESVKMPSPTKRACLEEPHMHEVRKLPMSEPVLKFAKLTDKAFTPTRGSKQAAGFDLYSAYDCVVPARGKALAKTDIQIALPDGCYGRVAPRSGLAYKHFIDVGAGVIDQDYRGNVGVVLFNFSDTDFQVARGDRVAQLVLERIFIPDLVELETLEETERGAGGFGSTGVSEKPSN